MTVNQLMFMCAVEEMSFSKAAEKSFVTQQCLSNHIQRLEKSCGVRLFERNPHLTLTEAGKILYQSYVQIRDIEETTSLKLRSEGEAVHGTIRFGTHLNRARIFLLQPFMQFNSRYPNVKLKVLFVHTMDAETMLAENRVDVVLGANGTLIPNAYREVIGEESIVFLASPKLLREKIPDWDLSRTTITMKELSLFPITAAANVSMMAQNLNHAMVYENLELNYIFLTDDNAAQLEFCKAGKAIMFCPENQLIGRESLFVPGSDDYIQVLKLESYADFMPIALFTSSQRQLPAYVTEFCSMVRDYYQEQIQEVRKILALNHNDSFSD